MPEVVDEGRSCWPTATAASSLEKPRINPPLAAKVADPSGPSLHRTPAGQM